MADLLNPRRSCLLLSLLLLCWAPGAFGEEGWERVATIEGVEIYQREARQIEGVAFRGVIETDLHVGQVIRVFVDAEERPHWVYRHADQEALDLEEPNGSWSERYWVRVDMPFPATDRDYVFHTVYEFRPDERVVTADIRSVEDRRKPEQECCVRARSITHYKVEALPGRERTRITVEVEVDLGGRLPAWITRGARREWPVETLRALVARAAQAGVDERVADWHEAVP